MFPEVQLGGSIQIDAPMLGPKQRTLSPAVTGGAILAVKVRFHSVPSRQTDSLVRGSITKYVFQYDKGVMVAGDTLGAYGGLHRFRDIRRVMRLNENVIVTYTGDTADFQHLQGRVLRTSPSSIRTDRPIWSMDLVIQNWFRNVGRYATRK